MEFFSCLNVLWMEEDGGGNASHRPGGNRELCDQKRANATVSKMAALRWQVQLSRREDRCGGGSGGAPALTPAARNSKAASVFSFCFQHTVKICYDLSRKSFPSNCTHVKK